MLALLTEIGFMPIHKDKQRPYFAFVIANALIVFIHNLLDTRRVKVPGSFGGWRRQVFPDDFPQRTSQPGSEGNGKPLFASIENLGGHDAIKCPEKHIFLRHTPQLISGGNTCSELDDLVIEKRYSDLKGMPHA